MYIRVENREASLKPILIIQAIMSWISIAIMRSWEVVWIRGESKPTKLANIKWKRSQGWLKGFWPEELERQSGHYLTVVLVTGNDRVLTTVLAKCSGNLLTCMITFNSHCPCGGYHLLTCRNLVIGKLRFNITAVLSTQYSHRIQHCPQNGKHSIHIYQNNYFFEHRLSSVQK